MALTDWPTTAVTTTTTDSDSDSIKLSRPDINQTIVNVNGFINSFGDLSNIADGQVLKYNSSQDKFLPADDDNTGGGGAQNVFSTISVAGESDVVADSNADTLTLVAGSNVTITTDAGNDSITIDSTGGGGATSPAGANGYIQYNDNGSFGGDQYFYISYPGGGTSCTFNHRGHFMTGLGVGANTSTISSGASTFQITHDTDDLFKIVVQTSSSNNDGLAGVDPAIRWGGDGAYGIYPQNTSFDSDQSHVTIAQGAIGRELKVKFRSNGNVTANIIMEDLPTADPNVAGQLWSNSGVLTVSSG